MKQLAIFLTIVVTLTSCRSGKKAIQTITPPVAVEEIIEAPEIVSLPKEEPINVTEIVDETVSEITEAFNHGSFDTLLKTNVSNDGVVNYNGFIQNRKALRDYIASLGTNMPTKDWTKEDKLVYWMNAYNAMTVDLILRNYPVESIKDINKPWNQRLWKLGDKWYNLDEIEHQILRKMNDPRIHFGINCASFSCPPLLNEAFTSKHVNSQLEDLTKKFINDTRRNSISENTIVISKIFNWFTKDFKKDGSLIDFLNKYVTTAIKPKAKVRYKDYNWDLNN